MRVAALVCAVAVLALAGTAAAVDAPKWVAAIYVEAQKSVGLRWSPIPGATGYKVLRAEKGGTAAEVAAPTVPQFFDTKVEPGSTYVYTLQAVAGAETSPNSDERSVAIPGQKKKEILAPELSQVVGQSSTEFGKTTFKVGLIWGKVADAVAYNVYRSEAAGKDYALVGSVSEDRYIDTAVAEGKTYYYVVSALDNGFQESKFSAEKSVTLVAEVKVVKEKAKVVKNEIVVKPTRTVAMLPLADDTPLESVADFLFNRDEAKAYVVDNLARKVVLFDENGKRTGDFGTGGVSPGQFQFPSGINISPDGDIIVTDLLRKVVIIFSPKGVFKREFRVDKKFKPEDKETAPIDCAQSPDGEYFVTDQNNGRILVYSSDGKELVRGIGEQATQQKSDLGTLSQPSHIVIDPAGRILVRDYGCARAQVLKTDGTPIMSLGENVKGLVGAFVKVGRPLPWDKEIIVPDNAMGNIQAFDAQTGAYLYTFTGPEGKLKFNERADWELGSTNMLDYDTQGRLWVSVNLDKRIAIVEIIKK